MELEPESAFFLDPSLSVLGHTPRIVRPLTQTPQPPAPPVLAQPESTTHEVSMGAGLTVDPKPLSPTPAHLPHKSPLSWRPSPPRAPSPSLGSYPLPESSPPSLSPPFLSPPHPDPA